jgi:DNA primase
VENNVEEIKHRLDIVSVVGSYVHLSKAGKNYKARCPFHSEKTPSFMVSPEIGLYKCFGCGKSGDIFSFVEEFERVDFKDALEILASRAGVRLVKSSPTGEKTRKEKILEANILACDFYHFILTKHRFGEEARKYLVNRKITDTTVKDFSLGYAPKSWESLGNYLLKKGFLITDLAAAGLVKAKPGGRGFYDIFRGRLMFPLKDNRGRVVGFSGRTLYNEDPKYINTQETEVFKKEAFLFGLCLAKDSIKKKGFAVVVEGEFDMMTPFQFGLSNVVASKGTALTRHQIGLLKNLCDEIILLFDADSAGIEAAMRGIELAESEGLHVKIGQLPKGIKDPDEAVKSDADAFFNLIRDAVGVYDYFLVVARSRFDLTTSIGKRRAGDFIAPKFARIENPLEKEYFQKKLANLLGVSQNAVIELIKNCESRKELSLTDTDVEKFCVSKKPDLEDLVLATVIKAPSPVAKKICDFLKPDYFKSPENREIIETLRDYYSNEKKHFSIKNFTKLFEGPSQEKVKTLYLFDVSNNLGDLADFEKQLTNLANKLKRETIKALLFEVGDKIKQAEAVGEAENLKKLQDKFSKLSKDLSS